MSEPAGRLLLVPTPLDFGVAEATDLQEVLPLGVIRQAAALTHWVAENARSARAFLKRVGAVVPLAQPLQATHIAELPRPAKGGAASAVDLTPLLEPAIRGVAIGLVSEAGLPAVADPGAALVRRAHELGIAVTPLPGASALLLGLAASGLNGQSFAFVGYLRSTTRIMASKYSRSRSARGWRSSGLCACTRAMISSDSTSIGLPVDSARTCARQTRSSL